MLHNENLTKLIELQRACNPGVPATKDQYVHTEQARGMAPLVDTVVDILDSQSPGTYMRLPFSGHIGSGKSSELMHVVRECNQKLAGKYYFIYVDVDAFLETLDVDTEDIYLGLVAELAREAASMRLDFAPGFFQKRYEEIKGWLFSDVTAGEVEAGKEGLKTKFRLQSTTAENRKKIRDALRGEDNSLRTHVNEAIIDFRVRLQKHFNAPNLQTVIVLDGCERIQRYKNNESGLESFKQLFIEDSSFLTELGSHLIVTMPINAARACYNSILARYDTGLQTMPSVKVTERDGITPDKEGRRAFQELLNCRLPNLNWSAYFSEKALDVLVHYSGGYVRGFMTAIREACSHAKRQNNQLPIQEQVAYSAFDGFVRNTTAVITPKKWEVLAALEANPTRTINIDDPDVQDLLAENLILEYVNGKQSKGFNKTAPWYAIHPVLKELDSFKVAQARIANAVEQPKP